MVNQTPHSLVRELRRVADLAELDDATLLEIVGASFNLAWKAGSRVFDVDDPGEALYVILSGRVRITNPEDDREVALLGPGDYFGAHSFLEDLTHSKRAEAVEDTELMVVPAEALHPGVADSPDRARRLRRTLEERLSRRPR